MEGPRIIRALAFIDEALADEHTPSEWYTILEKVEAILTGEDDV